MNDTVERNLNLRKDDQIFLGASFVVLLTELLDCPMQTHPEYTEQMHYGFHVTRNSISAQGETHLTLVLRSYWHLALICCSRYNAILRWYTVHTCITDYSYSFIVVNILKYECIWSRYAAVYHINYTSCHTHSSVKAAITTSNTSLHVLQIFSVYPSTLLWFKSSSCFPAVTIIMLISCLWPICMKRCYIINMCIQSRMHIWMRTHLQ